MAQQLDEQDRSKAILDRVERENASVLDSAMRKASDHFAARDAVREGQGADAIEVWGRRIGRALGAVAFALLLLNFVTGWFF
jgi:CHASE3 domain sensor protein